MKTVLLLLFCCVLTKASNSIYEVSCSDRSEGLHFEPVSGIRGRFSLQWCTAADARVNKWKLDLSYYPSLKPEQCNSKFSGVDHLLHSSFEEDVQVNLNCTEVCFKTNLDAIFSSTCYQMSTYQISKKTGQTLLYHGQLNHYVRENDTDLTKIQVSEGDTSAHYQKDGEDVIIDWYTDIPASLYHAYISLPNKSEVYADMNCSSRAPQLVRCRARAPWGRYRAWFHHDAAWTSLALVRDRLKFHSDFNHVEPSQGVTVSTSSMTSGLWWAVGAVGVALLLGLLALVLHHLVKSDKLKQNVRQSWIVEVIRRHLARRRPARAPERIVLLYARDCPPMVRAAELLASLLQHAAGCEVVDLYSPETVAAAAPAGGPWLRELLARAGTRVVLLQSPALAMYCARLTDADKEVTLEAPLLGSRVAWRRPHAADALLLLALRLLADGAPGEPLPFRKYYVAAVEGVRYDDVVPALTPGRRYVLPGTAPALLADLAPALEPPDPRAGPPLDPAARHLLEQLREALEDFRTYTLAHPDHLYDDLVLDVNPPV